jgi:hypothetical protein
MHAEELLRNAAVRREPIRLRITTRYVVQQNKRDKIGSAPDFAGDGPARRTEAFQVSSGSFKT